MHHREKQYYVLTKYYLGHNIGRDGIKPSHDNVAAILKYPRPTCVSEVRSFVGLASNYRKFVNNFAHLASSLTSLLKKETTFQWTDEQEAAFSQLKMVLTSRPVLAPYDPARETELRTDASACGFGAILVQKHGGYFKPVYYASRVTNEHECNYSATHLEAAAIIWAVQKLEPYLVNIQFTIVADHGSLQFMNGGRLSGKLWRWAMILQRFNYTIIYKPGKQHKDADALSRHTTLTDKNATELGDEDREFALVLREGHYIRPPLTPTIEANFLAKLRLTLGLTHPLTKEQERIHRDYQLKHGQIYRKTPAGDRLVPNIEERLMIIQNYHDSEHSGHRGIVETYHRVSEKYYWPGTVGQIRNYVPCHRCQQSKSSRTLRYPLLPIEVDRPFQKVGLDLSGNIDNKALVIAVDYFTKWVEARWLTSTDSRSIADFIIDDLFCRHGAPENIITDNANNINSRLIRNITATIGTNKINISTYRSETNGQIERTIRTIKAILRTQEPPISEPKLRSALFAYNTTPTRTTRFSPFYLLRGKGQGITNKCALKQNDDGDKTKNVPCSIMNSPAVTTNVTMIVRRES